MQCCVPPAVQSFPVAQLQCAKYSRSTTAGLRLVHCTLKSLVRIRVVCVWRIFRRYSWKHWSNYILHNMLIAHLHSFAARLSHSRFWLMTRAFCIQRALWFIWTVCFCCLLVRNASIKHPWNGCEKYNNDWMRTHTPFVICFFFLYVVSQLGCLKLN